MSGARSIADTLIDIPAMDTDSKQEPSRNLATTVVAAVGRLVATGEWEPYRLLDPDGVAVEAQAVVPGVPSG